MMPEEDLSTARSYTAGCRWADAVLNPSFRSQMATGNRVTAEEVEEMRDAVSQTLHDLTRGTTTQAVQTAAFTCGHCSSEIEFVWCSANENENQGNSCSTGCIPWRQAFDLVRTRAAACGGRYTGREGEQMKVWSVAGEDNYGTLEGSSVQNSDGDNCPPVECRTRSGSGGLRVIQLEGGEGNDDHVVLGRSRSVSRDNLHIYLTYSHKIGISPCGGAEENYDGKCSTLKKILCAAFSFVSSLQSFRHLKHSAMVFLAHGGQVKPFVRFAFSGMLAFTKANFLYLLHFKKPKIFDVVRKIQQVKEMREEMTDTKGSSTVVKLLIVGTIVTALARIAFATYAFDGKWTMKKSVEESAVQLGKTVFAWNSSSYQEDTNEVGDKYVKDMTWTTYVLAGINSVLDFCGITQDDLFRNIVLIAARVVSEEMVVFVATITLRGALAAETAEEKRRKLRWLLAIRAMVVGINSTLGIAMLLLTADNLLLSGYLLLGAMKHDVSVSMISLGARVIKVIVSQFYGMKIKTMVTENKNKPILEWLRKNRDMEGVVDENGEYVTIDEIIQRFEDEPLSLGVTGCAIDAEFVKQFWTAVVSLFLFLATIHEKDNELAAHLIAAINATVH